MAFSHNINNSSSDSNSSPSKDSNSSPSAIQLTSPHSAQDDMVINIQRAMNQNDAKKERHINIMDGYDYDEEKNAYPGYQKAQTAPTMDNKHTPVNLTPDAKTLSSAQTSCSFRSFCCNWYPVGATGGEIYKVIKSRGIQMTGTVGSGVSTMVSAIAAGTYLSKLGSWEGDVQYYTVLGASFSIGLAMAYSYWHGMSKGAHYMNVFEPRLNTAEAKLQGQDAIIRNTSEQLSKHKDASHKELARLKRDLKNAQAENKKMFQMMGKLQKELNALKSNKNKKEPSFQLPRLFSRRTNTDGPPPLVRDVSKEDLNSPPTLEASTP